MNLALDLVQNYLVLGINLVLFGKFTYFLLVDLLNLGDLDPSSLSSKNNNFSNNTNNFNNASVISRALTVSAGPQLIYFNYFIFIDYNG